MAFSSLVRRHCLTSLPMSGGDKFHALQQKKVVRLRVLYGTLCSAHAHCKTFCQGLMVCVLVFVLSMLSTGERVNDTVGGIWARTRISPILKIYPKHPSKFFTILTFPSTKCDLWLLYFCKEKFQILPSHPSKSLSIMKIYNYLYCVKSIDLQMLKWRIGQIF